MNAKLRSRWLFQAKCPCVPYHLELLTLAQGARKSKQMLTRSGHKMGLQRHRWEVGFHAWVSASMARGRLVSERPTGQLSKGGVPRGFTSNNRCSDTFVVSTRVQCSNVLERSLRIY